MHYGNLKPYDIANGPGVRVTLFVSGCRNQCPGCFQKETWDFNYGTPFTQETIDTILKYLAPAHVQGLTLLGGEPMEPSNQEGLLPLVEQVRATYPEKTIWCFTGYTYEALTAGEGRSVTAVTKELLSHLDVLVDGRFVEALKDITLLFRGSRNQRLIDIKATQSSGVVTLWENER